MTSHLDPKRRRWLALGVLCLGVLMIVLDTTIVNVALPSIRADLHFTETSLVWVVNAYMLSFGGFMLLGGRLGDLYGHRRMFLAGLALFTRAPADGGFWIDVLPGMLLLGLGAGVAFNPVLLAAMSEVAPSESGLASGVVNTSFMMGGSLGLAVLASLAAARTAELGALGAAMPAALAGGYRVAFAVGAAFAASGGLLALLLREPAPQGGAAAPVAHAG